jgi:hypothetical protein
VNSHSSIQMLSISGNTIHFHCSFFTDKASRLLLGMHRISGRSDNPAFFDIRHPAGYQIALSDIR